MCLQPLGIFGWSERDENLLLASLLTGDPLLLIGNHGCAKTHLGNKIAQALGKKYLVYDASKAMFEDILGFPNTSKLQQDIRAQAGAEKDSKRCCGNTAYPPRALRNSSCKRSPNSPRTNTKSTRPISTRSSTRTASCAWPGT